MRDVLRELTWVGRDLLRGSVEAVGYGRVLLCLLLLRRHQCLVGGTAGAEGARAAEAGLGADPVEELLTLAAQPPAGIAGLAPDLDLHLLLSRSRRRGVAQLAALLVRFDLRRCVVSDQQFQVLTDELLEQSSEFGKRLGQPDVPSEVAALGAALLVGGDDGLDDGEPVDVYDPACGTGGMLAHVHAALAAGGRSGQIRLFGQEVAPEACGIARARLAAYGAVGPALVVEDSLVSDMDAGQEFRYVTAALPSVSSWREGSGAIRQEFEGLGALGRFGAGLPRLADGSLLYVQQVVSHMAGPSAGGARAAVILTDRSMSAGGPESGDSSIREWLLERDLLEGIVALPQGLVRTANHNLLLLVLSTRKKASLQGRFVALDARASRATLAEAPSLRPDGAGALSAGVSARIVREYVAALDDKAAKDGRARVLPYDALRYQTLTVHTPMRFIHRVTPAHLDRWAKRGLFQSAPDETALVTALRQLEGQDFRTIDTFRTALRDELEAAGFAEPLPVGLQRRIERDIAKPDPSGEPQLGPDGSPSPDHVLEAVHRLPLDVDPQEFFDQQIAPDWPDSSIAVTKSASGCGLGADLFQPSAWRDALVPLSVVVQRVTRLGMSDEDGSLPVLVSSDLRPEVRAADLPPRGSANGMFMPCRDGDIVGTMSGRWCVLPDGFGAAATQLVVLRPARPHYAKPLCEWLNSLPRRTRPGQVLSMDTPVPVAAVRSMELAALLGDVDEGRSRLAHTAATLLPNLFHDSSGVVGALQDARSQAAQARLISELLPTLGDPVWRAETAYPYHIAGRARRYRVATSPAERMDALLKLAESIARTLGVVALAIMIQRKQGFTGSDRARFRSGANFGTWNWIIKDLLAMGPVTELPELEAALDPDGPHAQLTTALEARNEAGHSFSVRAAHRLAAIASDLEPTVIGALEGVGWLSQVHFDAIDQCLFTGDGFALVGHRLRGSHPEWEPFERPAAIPITPHRLYVEGPSTPAPIPLWPIASVEICPECGDQELFLLKHVRGKVLTLRSDREHELDRDLP